MKKCCVLGSVNRAKYNGARKALSLLGVEKIYMIRIEGLNPQPIGFEEIYRGAYIRAVKAYKYKPECYGLGIEAGIIRIGDYYLSGQIAVFTDGVKTSIGLSSFFPLPHSIAEEILNKNTELREVMRKQSGIQDIAETIGAIGYYTKGFMTRTDLSYQAVLAAIIPWLNTNMGTIGSSREKL